MLNIFIFQAINVVAQPKPIKNYATQVLELGDLTSTQTLFTNVSTFITNIQAFVTNNRIFVINIPTFAINV
ncbi:hypothetical protein H6G76_07585 [Nostoc sp. FACHB-152]|uniref:hypothetical protein n=1 Tax=unclassified Nostoc TaxID=2593658 RepID=UPI0016844D3A|nr:MULTISPECIES: hypothetical protein [unclassified Nostoc]MBD2447027.1 hypothetical protein [Nostoc sp. FACHB-152]MBD2470310.1 hypothetical protein [Nostoc sp. FACHB-145]